MVSKKVEDRNLRRQRPEGERTIGKGVSTINIEKIPLNKKTMPNNSVSTIWKNKGTEMAYSFPQGPTTNGSMWDCFQALGLEIMWMDGKGLDGLLGK